MFQVAPSPLPTYSSWLHAHVSAYPLCNVQCILVFRHLTGPGPSCVQGVRALILRSPHLSSPDVVLREGMETLQKLLRLPPKLKQWRRRTNVETDEEIGLRLLLQNMFEILKPKHGAPRILDLDEVFNVRIFALWYVCYLQRWWQDQFASMNPIRYLPILPWPKKISLRSIFQFAPAWTNEQVFPLCLGQGLIEGMDQRSSDCFEPTSGCCPMDCAGI